MLRIPHCLDNRLRDGGEDVRLTRRPRSTPQKHFLVLISVRDWVNPRTIVRLEGLDKDKNVHNLIGTRTRDASACTVVPQPTSLSHALSFVTNKCIILRGRFHTVPCLIWYEVPFVQWRLMLHVWIRISALVRTHVSSISGPQLPNTTAVLYNACAHHFIHVGKKLAVTTFHIRDQPSNEGSRYSMT
jgi:hypothetical protein